MYRSDCEKLDGSFREHVQRNIENFVNEEQKKAPRSMQLAWVAEASEMSVSQDPLDQGNASKATPRHKLKQKSSVTPKGAQNSKSSATELKSKTDQTSG